MVLHGLTWMAVTPTRRFYSSSSSSSTVQQSKISEPFTLHDPVTMEQEMNALDLFGYPAATTQQQQHQQQH